MYLLLLLVSLWADLLRKFAVEYCNVSGSFEIVTTDSSVMSLSSFRIFVPQLSYLLHGAQSFLIS